MPHFYSLTLQKASCINQAVYGNFSLPKAQEIVVARGTLLELLRPDDNGHVQVVCSHEVFGLIRSLAVFRLVGAKRDYVVVGSDSGRIVVLEFDVQLGFFVKVIEETYGRSGCRRVVAGEYLAVDPAGRACMIGAIEKQKFVYILNRDLRQKLTISSPLEAHKSGTLVFGICALDVGFENPLFASLEQDISVPGRPLQYTIYEMDLGINHVSRKFAEPVPDSAHLLIPVPDLGGCLICCSSGELLYKKLGQPTLTCGFPRRADSPTAPLVVAHATRKLKDFCLILVQTNLGDIFRIDFLPDFSISYFDTLPFRAVSLCILKTGFLFAAAELGDHALYQFQGDLHAPNIPSPDPFLAKILSSLLLVTPVSSLSALTDIKIMDPLVESASGGACQIYALCGGGQRSALRVLRQGLGVSELAVSELPGKPSGLWTIADEGDATKYIVISFTDVTLVLAVGESVEEVSDSGFLASVPSLLCAKTTSGALVQVHPGGIRFVSTASVIEWRSGGQTRVTCGAYWGENVIVGLETGEIVLVSVGGLERGRRNFGSEICALSLNENFAAIAGTDRAVRIVAIEPGVKFLKQVSAQSYAVVASSVAISNAAWLHIGLSDGTLVRCVLDKVTGGLSDARTRVLGSRPVRLQNLNQSDLIALSSRPWLIAEDDVPRVLSYLEDNQLPVVLELGAGFTDNGIVSVSETTLRIISVNERKTNFCQTVLPLSYTPRKLVLIPSIGAASNNLFVNESSMLAIIEADCNVFTPDAKKSLAAEFANTDLCSDSVGHLVPRASCWGSCVRIVDPTSLATKFHMEFENNECAVAIAVAYFYQLKDRRPCLVVATAKDLELRPKRTAKVSTLKTYLYDANFSLQLVHTTILEAPVLAMCPYEGRLLVSLTDDSDSSLLRLYELGKKKLLKKTEYRNLHHCGGFVSIQVVNDRIFAADVFNSVHVLKLNKIDGQLFVVCDDTLPRYVSAMLAVDYNTVVGGDKFDNFFAITVPSEVKDEGTGESGRLGPDTAYILGKTKKFDPSNSFHLGQTITAIQRVTMSAGSSEVLLYSTLSGSIGAMCPIRSKKEFNFLLALESELRQTSLVGRDHVAFRSFYLPTKGVIDGDLIAQEFPRSTRKAEIGEKLGKTVNEIHKIIEEMLYRIT